MEEGRWKMEDGKNYRFQVEPGNAFQSCCASSFLRGGRASRNSFLGRAKERDNESRNERFQSCCASSFLRGGRTSRNSFLGRAKERDNESRNERFLR
jgi:hypothetical protein